jgi:peroxiredoxin
MKSDFYENLKSFEYNQKRDFNDFIKTAKAQQGSPKVFQSQVGKVDFQFIDYYSLDTKNDSIDVFIGHFKDEDVKKNWFCLTVNDSIENFYTAHFTKDKNIFKESLGDDFSTDISFSFYNQKYGAYLKLKYLDTIESRLEYSWSKGFEPMDSITISLSEPLYVGNKIPKINLKNLKGHKIDLEEYNSQPIVLFWCNFDFNICLEQTPYLNQLAEKYADKNVKFIAVINDDIEDIKNYIDRNTFKYQVTTVDKSSIALFGSGMPLNLIIDNKGIVSYYKRGSCKDPNCIYDALNQELIKLFKNDL